MGNSDPEVAAGALIGVLIELSPRLPMHRRLSPVSSAVAAISRRCRKPGDAIRTETTGSLLTRHALAPQMHATAPMLLRMRPLGRRPAAAERPNAPRRRPVPGRRQIRRGAAEPRPHRPPARQPIR